MKIPYVFVTEVIICDIYVCILVLNEFSDLIFCSKIGLA